MRSGLAAAVMVFCLAQVAPVSAQLTGPTRPGTAPEILGRGTVAPLSNDAVAEAERRRSEARLRQREEKARRTLRGICRGC